MRPSDDLGHSQAQGVVLAVVLVAVGTAASVAPLGWWMTLGGGTRWLFGFPLPSFQLQGDTAWDGYPTIFWWNVGVNAGVWCGLAAVAGWGWTRFQSATGGRWILAAATGLPVLAVVGCWLWQLIAFAPDFIAAHR